jgi:hypothetical protein
MYRSSVSLASPYFSMNLATLWVTQVGAGLRQAAYLSGDLSDKGIGLTQKDIPAEESFPPSEPKGNRKQ